MAETRKTAHWARTAVTTGGLDLLTDYAAGRVLEITAAYGSSAAEGDISTLTDLPDGKAHPLTIESVVKSKDHVTICIQVSSVGVTEAYKLEQIGIYAASGDTNGYRTEERLLMVIEDEADENGSKGVTVPVESDQLYTFKLYAVLAITNKDRLEVNLSSAGLATLESVQLAISQALGKETPPLEDSGAPTEETAGSVGQTYTDTETGESYTCTGVTEDGRYIWTSGAVGTLDQIRKATGENTAGLAAANAALLAVKSELEAHTADQENPHGVTPAGIGAATTATYEATFPAAGWSAAAPYQQTVAVAGITVLDNPIAGQLFRDDEEEGAAAYNTQALEEWGYVSRITTAEGSITGICFEDKPTVDIRVQLKVVR